MSQKNFHSERCQCASCQTEAPAPQRVEIEKTIRVRGHLCPGCGEAYEPARPTQVWCAPACGHRWRRERKKACLFRWDSGAELATDVTVKIH